MPFSRILEDGTVFRSVFKEEGYIDIILYCTPNWSSLDSPYIACLHLISNSSESNMINHKSRVNREIVIDLTVYNVVIKLLNYSVVCLPLPVLNTYPW